MTAIRGQIAGSLPGTESRARWASLLLFASFFPYPAVVTLGNSWGIQAAQLVIIILVALRYREISATRSVHAYLWLALPMFGSLAVVSIASQTRDPDLGVRAFLTFGVTLLALPVFGSIFQGRDRDWFVRPVALVMVVNLGVAVYQAIQFRSGTFPFLWYFQNPSFADLNQIAGDYARYVGRPMGIFPEPSAMAAAIGPWGVMLLGRAVARDGKHTTACWIGAVCAASAVSLSASVYAAVMVLLYAVVLLRSRLRGVAVAGMVLAATGVAWGWLASPDLARLDIDVNTSMATRYRALEAAVQLPFESVGRALFGYGPGSGVAVVRDFNPYLGGVYSLLGTWWLEGGLGVAAGVAAVISMAWRRASTRYVKTALVAWIVSIGAATGYQSLLPLWLFLALVLDGAVSGGCGERGGELSNSTCPDLTATR